MRWDRDEVERWLENAVDILRRMPDIEERYLRNALRSRFPEAAETMATAFAAAVGAYEVEGAVYDRRTKPAEPAPREIDMMEAVILGIPKPNLGVAGGTPWLEWLTRKQQNLVLDHAKGRSWDEITAKARRGHKVPTERTLKRHYRQALDLIVEELVTLDHG